jgi:hypothetical protein
LLLILLIILAEDIDGDRMLDSWEVQYGLDPTDPDMHLDADKDGFHNQEEFEEGSNPSTANSIHSIADSLPDPIALPH